MVIYGHDEQANQALFDWLRAIGLEPQEWGQLIQATGSASPYIGQVLEQALRNVQAVIAYFTPDEYVTAASLASGEGRLQARPNVLIEAGMALVTHPTRTVIAVLGDQELPSDLSGRHYVRLSHTDATPLRDLANRLSDAGCNTNLDGTGWLDPALFPDRTRPIQASGNPQGSEGADAYIWSDTYTYDLGSRESAGQPPRQPGPTVTDRWTNLTNGAGFPALMETGRHTISHPAYRDDDRSPSMQSAVLMACSPLNTTLSTTKIRTSFLAFLNGPAVAVVLNATTNIAPNSTWISWGDQPRSTFSAVLGSDSQQAPPDAWARLTLPQEETSYYDHAPGSAHFVLHISPRTADGALAPAVTLPIWYDRLMRLLDLPDALAEFLNNDLSLSTSDDPPVQVGTCLKAAHTMTELVDIQNLQALAGTSPSSWFRAWAVAERTGRPPRELVTGWLTQLCDSTLYVTDYEHLLHKLPEHGPVSAPTGA